jgi:hypothetical protein
LQIHHKMAFSYAAALTHVRAKPTKYIFPSEYVGKYFGVIEPVKTTKSFNPRRAYWGDIVMYNEKEDGPLQDYLDASAKKRAETKTHTVVPTEQEREEELQRFKAEVERKERLREQARVQARDPRDKETQCKCGCGRNVHINPLPEFVGYCCNWCKKHNGKRGHGEACGKSCA